MIEDVLVWKFVAEHQLLHKSQLEPGILIVIVRTVALIAPSPGSRCKQSTNALMLLTSRSKLFRLR